VDTKERISLYITNVNIGVYRICLYAFFKYE